MNFIQHPLCNTVLAAPPGVSIDECRALPIRRAQFSDGAPCVQSFWKPTPEELALLNAGEPVIFTAWGTTHPPVILEVMELPRE